MVFLFEDPVICRWQAASSQDGLGGFMVSGGNTFGGWNETLKTTEVYRAGRWAYGPEMPRAIWDHCQVLLGDTVYITGGQTQNYTYGMSHAFTNMLTLKSKNGGNWIEVDSPAVIPRESHTCAAHAGKMYVIGGWMDDGFTLNELSSVEIFDPSSETWSFGPKLPKTLNKALAVSWGGSLWVLGGFSNYIDNNVIYRLDEGSWRDAGNYTNIDRTVVEYNNTIRGQIVNEDIIHC